MVQAARNSLSIWVEGGGVSRTYANESVGQPWGIVKRIYSESMIDELYRYFCGVQYFVYSNLLKKHFLSNAQQCN